VDRWCEERALPRGAIVSLGQCLRLSLAWYPGRLTAEWRRMNAMETQATFESVGLTGEFWQVV
jgi:hypothetical protein